MNQVRASQPVSVFTWILSDTETTSSPPAIIKNHQETDETLFSNFSASTRAVIGSCLAAIQCLETEAETDCVRLSELCYSQGPAQSQSPALPSRLGLECRVENILCHVETSGREEDRAACDDKFDLCRSDQSAFSKKGDSGHFNATMMGEYYTIDDVHSHNFSPL